MDPLAIVKELGGFGLAIWIVIRLETRWVPVWERLLEYLIRAEAREREDDDAEVHKPEVSGGARRDGVRRRAGVPGRAVAE